MTYIEVLEKLDDQLFDKVFCDWTKDIDLMQRYKLDEERGVMYTWTRRLGKGYVINMSTKTYEIIRNCPDFDGLHLEIGELSENPTKIGFHYRVATITSPNNLS